MILSVINKLEEENTALKVKVKELENRINEKSPRRNSIHSVEGKVNIQFLVWCINNFIENEETMQDVFTKGMYLYTQSQLIERTKQNNLQKEEIIRIKREMENLESKLKINEERLESKIKGRIDEIGEQLNFADSKIHQTFRGEGKSTTKLFSLDWDNSAIPK